jgi:hypothetical protein
MKKKTIIGYLKDILVNSIRALKDEDYQKRIWFRMEGPEVDSYFDTTVHLIDRCQVLFKDPSCAEDLGNENYILLKRLHDLVLEHVHATEERINVEELQERELLDDPKWHAIQTLAIELETKLKNFIKEQENE